MREIDVSKIKEAVAELCIRANFKLRRDVLSAIKAALKKETDRRARDILKSIIENARLAKGKHLAICQDTGIAVVFLEIGEDVAIVGGDLSEAVDDGVREGYGRGYLRKSIVEDPLFSRKNTSDNAPASIHLDMVKGDKIKIAVLPKGSGSENKSAIKMFNPTAGLEEVKEFILDTVSSAGPGACPPFVVGVG
ncbi:MAG: fumarate hydratase, partial [Candidatus Omnitrophica bacterium CG1_02_49_10]